MAYYDTSKKTEDRIHVSGPCVLMRDSGPGSILEGTASQVRSFINVTENADSTGFIGNLTEAQMYATSSPNAGDWCKVTDLGYEQWVYDGNFWLSSRHRVVEQRTGDVSVKGQVVRIVRNSAYDDAVELAPASDLRAHGIVVTGGVANGGDIVICTSGRCEIMCRPDEDVLTGEYLAVSGDTAGVCLATTSTNGVIGFALESKVDRSFFLIKAHLGLTAEI